MTKGKQLNDPADATVSLIFLLKRGNISVFNPILQQGFQVGAKIGCDIQSLLCEQYAMSPEYLSERISTVFLNGRPVDDVASAVVHDGDTLALSAAMPGLVGATLRRSGCLAAFRGSITYQPNGDPQAACYNGSITLKLFNLLTGEVGPSFLAQGISISGEVFSDFWEMHASEVKAALEAITMDGLDLNPEKIDTMQRQSLDARILLRATCSD